LRKSSFGRNLFDSRAYNYIEKANNTTKRRTEMDAYNEYLKKMPKTEIVALRSDLYRQERQEKAATGGRDLRSEVASSNLKTIQEHLAKVEKVCRQRRIP
jgi:hypothetical protein